MLLKKLKIVSGVQFVKCWFSKDTDRSICKHCKFYNLEIDENICHTRLIGSNCIDVGYACTRSTEYNDILRKPDTDSFTSYIPDQDLYYMDEGTRKIKKIEKT